MAEFEVVDLSEDGERARIADAVIALSNAVLGLGVALTGAPAMRAALGREVEVSPVLAELLGEDVDGQDPAGLGVNEDERRPPEDGEGWLCPSGAPEIACAALHDHYPTPQKRR